MELHRRAIRFSSLDDLMVRRAGDVAECGSADALERCVVRLGRYAGDADGGAVRERVTRDALAMAALSRGDGLPRALLRAQSLVRTRRSGEPMSNDALALSAFCLACLLHGVAEVADCAVARENGDAEEVRCTILTEVAFAWWCHPGVNPDSIVSLHAVCTLLRMGSPARAVASEIVMNIEREGLRGRHSPHSLAAVAVIRTCELLCLHPTMTQQQFCNLLDVTDNTIRGILRTLSSKWERLDPERLRLPKPIWLREYPRPSRVLSRGGHVIAPAVPEIVRPAFTFEDAIAFHHRTRQHLPPSS